MIISSPVRRTTLQITEADIIIKIQMYQGDGDLYPKISK